VLAAAAPPRVARQLMALWRDKTFQALALTFLARGAVPVPGASTAGGCRRWRTGSAGRRLLSESTIEEWQRWLIPCRRCGA